MNEVTRNSTAATALEVAAAERTRRTVPNGVWGMLLFVATEATLFGTLIATYFYLRFNSRQWPPAGIEAPAVTAPLLLTGVLVLSVAPMLLAAGAARRGRARTAWLLVLAATLIQGAYLAWQVVLYLDDLSKFAPTATAYGSIYFTLLAAHHAHVALGLLLDGWVLARLLGGLTAYRATTVQAVALYWVVVAGLAVAVVLTQVSPS